MSDHAFPSILPYEHRYNGRNKTSMDGLQNPLAYEARPSLAIYCDPPSPAVLIHLERIHALQRAEKNAGLPIARIPVEILRVVFQHHADENEIVLVQRFFTMVHSVERSWFILGQVCRRWRQTLFDMPELWSRKILELDVRKGLELIPFTKTMLLDIDLYNRRHVSEQTWSDWEPHMGRAWRITHGDDRIDDVVSFMNLLSSKILPQLRAVRLVRYYRQGCLYDAIMADHPQLQSVTMDRVYMRPPLLGKLLSLDINLLHHDVRQRPSYNMLFHVLSLNTQLQYLSLRGMLDENVHVVSAVAQRLTLPTLTTVRLGHQDHTHSIYILDGMHLPALQTAELEPEIYVNSYPADYVVPLYRSLLGAWTYGTRFELITTLPSLTVTRFHRFPEVARHNLESLFRAYLNEISRELGMRFSVAQHFEGTDADRTLRYDIRREL